MKKNIFFSFFFFLFSLHVLAVLCVLIRVRTKTEWRVVESKVVFDAVHRGPTVSAGVVVADRFPNGVCECIVEDLRRAIDFTSSAAANAIGNRDVLDVDRKRGRRGDFDLLCLFLFLAVRKHNPVRRVGKDDARLPTGVFQTLLKVLGYDTWNPE